MATSNSINERIQLLVKEFSEFSDWEDRYKYIIDLGKALPAMDEQYKVDDNIVKGCQSKVWLWAFDEGGVIKLQADSDASIVKGIIALLLRVYSGSSAEEIIATKPDFLEDIGLKQHLSMSRANGLNSMLKQISMYAVAFKAKRDLGL